MEATINENARQKENEICAAQKLLKASAATIVRVLSTFKVNGERYEKRAALAALRSQIPHMEMSWTERNALPAVVSDRNESEASRTHDEVFIRAWLKKERDKALNALSACVAKMQAEETSYARKAGEKRVRGATAGGGCKMASL